MTSPVYCTSTHVSSLLGITAFGVSTTPTQAQIEEMIYRWEDFIDEITGHAWRAASSPTEYYDTRSDMLTRGFVRIALNHRSIREVNAVDGDTFEIWNGSEWINALTALTEGRANDYWINYGEGILYLKKYYQFGEDVVKIKYRYGESTVPKDIQDACAKFTACDILLQDDRSALIPEGFNTQLGSREKIEKWKNDAERVIAKRAEVRVVI